MKPTLTPTSVALAGLSLSTLLSALGTSIANVALPTLAQAFGASFPQVQWVVLAYLLVITSGVVGIGRLGDLVGRRRLLLAGIGVFTAASALCSVAPTLPLLVAGRALQGLGAATMMALGLALVSDTVGKARTGSALGLMASMSAVGTALGPSLGGLLISAWGWQAIFVVQVPLGLLALLFVQRGLPRDSVASARPRTGFDPLGTVLLALTLAAYALSMTAGRDSSALLSPVLLSAAAAGMALFLFAESRVASPLLRLALFRDAVLSTTLGMTALVSTVVMSTLVVGPFYLARTLGLGPAAVGLALSVGPLVAAMTGLPAGRLVDRLGARRVLLLGLAAMATGCSVLSLLPAAWGVAGYLVPLAVVTAGYALFQTASSSTVMAGASANGRGLMSGILNLSRNLGFITGASAMGAVFALAASTTDITSAPAGQVATGMRISFAVAAGLVALALCIALAGPAFSAWRRMPRGLLP